MPIQYDGASKVIRRICQAINMSSSVVTLAASDWVYSNVYGTWAQTVSVNWMTANKDIEVSPVVPSSKVEREAVFAARVSCVASGVGTLTFIADSEAVPTETISMNVHQLL